MKVIITGASGMLGQAVLKESLADDSISSILIVSRTPLNIEHGKVKEVVLKDFLDVDSIASELQGYDACFFCAGTSSSSMGEELYRKLTVDMTLKFARTLVGINPNMSFTYVSAHGSDASSKTMWARVKGQAENELKDVGFKNLYIFRPAMTHPEPGIEIKSAWNARILFFAKPLYPLLKLMFPRLVTTTSRFGRAMILVAREGLDQSIYHVTDINRLVEAE